MNWYLEQKEAWNWKAMLPGNKPDQNAPQAPAKAPGKAPAAPAKPQRSRQEVEGEKKQVQMQMNLLRGPQRGSPGAKEKLEQLQQKFQQLLQESSVLHEVSLSN